MVNYPFPPVINQFDLSPVPGQLDLLAPSTVITAQVDAAQGTALLAGQAVKLATTSGGVPKVLGLASNTDSTFAFVVRNLKDQNFPASSYVEIAFNDAIMWMQADGAITRGAAVEVVYTTNKVITSAGINPAIGLSLDTATVTGDLIRVLIKVPSVSGAAGNPNVKTISVTASLAQINAGLVLIPGVTGEKITPLNYVARVNGNFASGTSVELEDTNGTPVAVTTIAEAGLTNGAVLLPSSGNTTLGAGFAAPLTSGAGLQVVNNGSAQTGGTSIQFTITYQQA